MNSASSVNRWVPFQCPLCFGLFRLRKAQIGSAGHCPNCRSLIHISGKSQSPPAVPDVVEDEPDKALLERLTVAQPMTPEELAEQEEIRNIRKRQASVVAADTIDWEEENKEMSDKGPSWLLVGSGFMGLVLLLAGGLFYVKHKAPGQSSSRSTVLGDSESKAKLDAILERSRDDSYKDEDGVDSTIAAVDQYKNFDMMKIEAVVKEFLSAGAVADRLKFVRDPERVEALMLRHYGGEKIEAEGFEKLDKVQVTYQSTLLTTAVQTADFLSYPIAVERIGKTEDGLYKVDWESWVGYSDFKPEEMRAQKPSDPFGMRVMVSKGSYYNYGFANDKEWACYRLTMRNSEFSFLGYAKRGSDIDKEFSEVLKNRERDSFFVNVAYPPNAKSKDQVEIIEILSPGWVINVDDEKSDE